MKIELDIECQKCDATGLYVGMAERDGSAVVCHTCSGTGRHRFTMEYEPFRGRKDREDVDWVIQVNPGICVGRGKGGNEYRLPDFGGQPYTTWRDGLPFPPKSEMRKFTCPAWWFQSADYKKKPDWEECIGIGAFSDCRHFKDKAKCWKRFDAEHPHA